MLSFVGTIADIKKKIFTLDQNKIYDIEIKIHREKRSLNANSYLWKLCTEIASVVNSDKDSIYIMMLKRYGVSDLIPISKEIPIKNYFDYFDIESETDKYFWYKIYKGSSKYNTKEMFILLNGVVSECKELGIETLTPDEIARLKFMDNVLNGK